MACIKRKLWRSYSSPRLLEIRAAIGTALTPALPISGFILLSFERKRFIIFTKSTPLADAMTKAKAPMAKILMVSSVRNSLAWVEQPTVSPSSITTMSLSDVEAVLARRSVFPLSFSRLPKNSMPSRGSPEGTMKVVMSRPMMGKSIFSVFDTFLPGFILITRSFFVVSRRMMNGCITGTSAMYE